VGTTFEVSAVSPDRAPLEPLELAAALSARGLRGIVAASAGDRALVQTTPLHGFAMALHAAYDRHRPLAFGPDEVWLCVGQGIARWIAANAEALRPRLVRHAGKLPIEVRRDALAADPGSIPEWSGAVSDLAEEVRAKLGGRAALFVAGWSTTDACSRVASQITLLGAVQSYFEYTVASLCGIPRVILGGTPEDWRDVRARAKVLHELDLGWWADALDPVLAEIEASAAGAPRRDFWERIYKEHHASGGESISGWCNVLFPFVGERGVQPNPWFAVGDEGNELELPKLRDLPSGLASAPFTWRLLTGDVPMQLVAGFVGVCRADDDPEAVRPAIGWAVAPAAPERRFRAFVQPGRTMLVPRAPAELVSLAGLDEELAFDDLRDATVSLSWCDALTSLEGVASPRVVELSLLSCSALERLDALAGARDLRRLRIQQCGRVVDLAPIASLDELVELGLAHNPALVDYAPIASLPRLQLLDLFGETVPPALRGRHTGPDAIRVVLAALRR